MEEIRHLKSLEPTKLTELAVQLKQPIFRIKQISKWLWEKRCIDFNEMTDIPALFRKYLTEHYLCNSIIHYQEAISKDKTRKYAFQFPDQQMIESVLIPSVDRITACISTQVGCALGCKFCATAGMGFIRNLTFEEIHDQIIMLMNFSEKVFQQSLTNLVVMGMGEPMLNYGNTIKALDYISNKDFLNFSPQRITISTSGVVPGIRKMAEENSPYKLAVSLHSAIDSKRISIMPVTKKYNLKDLSEALIYYHRKTDRRFTIEYILFEGFNDGGEDAEALARFCRPFPVKINIIPYNQTSGNKLSKSSANRTDAFIGFLESKNMLVQKRQSRGTDIQAACGQLIKTINSQII